MEPTALLDESLQGLDQVEMDRAGAETMLQAFGSLIGIDTLEVDGSDSVALVIPHEAGEVLVTLTFLAGRPGLYAAADMPDSEQFHSDVLAMTLRQNADWHSTNAGTFGIVPGSGRLTLSSFLVVSLREDGQFDLASFDEQVARFAEAALSWQIALEDYIEELEERACPHPSAKGEGGHTAGPVALQV